MSANKELPVELSEAEKYDYIYFTWCDFHGVARSRCVPRTSLKSALKQGFGIPAGMLAVGPMGQPPEVLSMSLMIDSSSPMYVGSGNVSVVAQPGTLRPKAWSGLKGKQKVGEVLCEMIWPDGTPQEQCPRYLARKQVQRLEDELGLHLLSAFEMEFLLLEEKTLKPLYEVADVFSSYAFAQQEQFFLDMMDKLIASGLDLSMFHLEMGTSQFEIIMNPVYGLESADTAFRFVEGCKVIAQQHNLLASFMGKLFPTEIGSGFHFNHSLWDRSGKDAFFDANNEDKLSDIARHWLGGIIKHTPALTALCCPTFNCYRRIHKPFLMSHCNWGLDDRMQTFRMKVGAPGSTYLENRLPSSSSNPYLVLAANVAAGIDGIINKIPLPPPGDEKAAELPHTLEEALSELEKDDVMVQALGQGFIQWFCGLKRETEVETFKDHDVQEDKEEEILKEIDFYMKPLKTGPRLNLSKL